MIEENKTKINSELPDNDLDSESIQLLESMQTEISKEAVDALFSESVDFAASYKHGETETQHS